MVNLMNNSHHIPILQNEKTKLESEEDRYREILSKPEMAAMIRAAAGELDKNFNSFTKLITDIRVGATFRDVFTKKLYAYEYITKGFDYDTRAKLIAKEAKKPLFELPEADMWMIVYEAESNPSPRYMVNAIDFCKMFAMRIWVLVDANNAEEKKFLNKVHQE